MKLSNFVCSCMHGKSLTKFEAKLAQKCTVADFLRAVQITNKAVFYNIYQLNFAMLLILRHSFKALSCDDRFCSFCLGQNLV